MMAFAPGGQFLRDSLEDTQPAGRSAQALAKRATDVLPVPSLDSDRHGPKVLPPLEAVAFTSSGSDLRLVYTTVLPLADLVGPAGRPDDERDLGDWVLLTPWVGRGNIPAKESLPQEHLLVRNYWRRQFEETSAVSEFLPRYFTTSQVRAAYSSLWGEEQHVGAFYRWLHDRDKPKTPLVRPVDEEVVRKHVERAFAVALKSSELGPQIDPRTPQLFPGAGVGVSVAMVAGSALGFLPAALLAGAVAGSLVAYQQRTGRGKKPLWYESAGHSRILIDDPYAPRPTWLRTGGRPAPFH